MVENTCSVFEKERERNLAFGIPYQGKVWSKEFAIAGKNKNEQTVNEYMMNEWQNRKIKWSKARWPQYGVMAKEGSH